jgi:pSer/pThr/pTyr-binding forkhead associated (FHA) protein
MTTHAPSRSLLTTTEFPFAGFPATDERPTAAIEAVAPPLRDAVEALDYRHRRRAVARAIATPGHYLALSGGDGEYVLPIDARLLHLGRSTTADIRFEDPRVSRCHAIVVRYGRHVRVLDDRSHAGTFVNDQRIVATDLADGDVIRLGPIALTYTIVR